MGGRKEKEEVEGVININRFTTKILCRECVHPQEK